MLIEYGIWSVFMMLVILYFLFRGNHKAAIKSCKVYALGVMAIVVMELFVLAGSVSPMG